MKSVWRPKGMFFCLFVLSMSLVFATHGNAAPSKAKVRTKSKRTPLPQTKTIILPIRYIKGTRMVRMLQMFVSHQEHRYTQIRYSPALHKLLIRSTPAVLQKLRKASKQIDTRQAQYKVQVYFLESLKGSSKEKVENENKDLFRFVKKTFPMKREFKLLEYNYVHAVNHQYLKFKATRYGRVRHPNIAMVIHHNAGSDDAMLVNFELSHHEKFTSSSQAGTNVKFVTSHHIKTQLFVKPGAFALVGLSPIETTKGYKKALVVLKIDRVQQSKASSQATGRIKKGNVRAVIQESKKHLKVCYEAVLKTKPKLQGRVVVSFTIQKTGLTSDVTFVSKTLKDKIVEDCILQTFRKMKFTPPSGGGIVKVRYPLSFTP